MRDSKHARATPRARVRPVWASRRACPAPTRADESKTASLEHDRHWGRTKRKPEPVSVDEIGVDREREGERARCRHRVPEGDAERLEGAREARCSHDFRHARENLEIAAEVVRCAKRVQQRPGCQPGRPSLGRIPSGSADDATRERPDATFASSLGLASQGMGKIACLGQEAVRRCIHVVG